MQVLELITIHHLTLSQQSQCYHIIGPPVYPSCLTILPHCDPLTGRLSTYLKPKSFSGVAPKDDEKVHVNRALYTEMLGISICEEF